jgi:hypothetical protein
VTYIGCLYSLEKPLKASCLSIVDCERVIPVMNVKEFENPSKMYRPSPFWSWNDALDPEELRWQVREFAAKGFGGYFMHSRVGLATPYLSKEWMNCIRACLEEGRKVNTESWLYDEDKWPSGFAGGKVPAKGDEYRGKIVTVKEIKPKELSGVLDDPTLLGIYRIQLSSQTKLKQFKRVAQPEKLRGGEHLLALKVEITQKTNWYNGESYADLLNPKAVEEFLRVTHDAYAKEFKADFGEYMPGIFTDEPTFSWLRSAPGLPWTNGMAECFQKINGYSLLDKLPLLFYDGEGCQKVRYDFCRTLTLRYVEAWTKRYVERCAKHGLMMTGHFLAEDTLESQIKHAGAAMPHYEYMQLPGIDHLGRNVRDALTLKQCSSVAHQFGRTRVLSEIFGTSGHSASFEDLKWIADFHFALGITFFCPHLTLYTMKGDAKRDWPPTISYHQPYWEHFKLANDYFSRGGYLCSQGTFVADILVLHTVGSGWATISAAPQDKNGPVWKYHDGLVKLQDELLVLHREFDYGDETILSRHGRVEGKEFVVKEGRYKVVVVPPSLTWAKTTVSLLRQFLKAGGKVLFVGETPSLIDGEPAGKQWQKILSYSNAVKVDPEEKKVAEALDKASPRTVSVTDDEGNEIGDVYVHHRVEGSRHIYFFANKSRTKRYNATIKLSEKGEVTEWDLYTGKVFHAAAVTTQGKTVIDAVFHPTGSRTYVVDTSKPPASKGSVATPKTTDKVKQLQKEWSFSRLHLNSLTLDTCRYSLDGGKWSEPMPIWKVRRKVWEDSGLGKLIGIQPWALKERNVRLEKPLELRMQAKYRSEIKGKKVFLILEKADLWRLAVNGKVISTDVEERYWDKQFGKIDISDAVQTGENIIELSCQFDLDVPVEDLYLVGNFGVKKLSETEYMLTDEPSSLKNGDWAKQGYPFYAGTMRYKASFYLEKKPGSNGRVLMRLPEAKGTLFLIRVNGKSPIPVCWSPLEADVTKLVRRNQNELTIDVVSSLRNTFGPLHNKLANPYFPEHYLVGPFSFTDEHNWTDAYLFVPYGLINGAELVIRRQVT